MPKDRLADLRRAANVSCTIVSQEPNNHEVAGDAPTHDPTSTLINLDDQCPVTDFLQETDSIISTIDHIEEHVKQVKEIHSKMLSIQPDSKLSGELDSKNDGIRKLANALTIRLKKIEDTLSETSGHNETSAQRRMKETQFYTLSRRFRDTMNQYNQEVLAHRDRCKNIILRELEMVGHGMSNDELEERLSGDLLTQMNGSILVDTQKAKQTLNDLEARQRDMKKLEETIRKLNEMFHDLARLVQDQGEILDRIEYNVEKAADYVDKAQSELGDAERWQSNNRKMKFIICIAIIIIVCLVFFILFPVISIQRKFLGR